MGRTRRQKKPGETARFSPLKRLLDAEAREQEYETNKALKGRILRAMRARDFALEQPRQEALQSHCYLHFVALTKAGGLCPICVGHLPDRRDRRK